MSQGRRAGQLGQLHHQPLLTPLFHQPHHRQRVETVVEQVVILGGLLLLHLGGQPRQHLITQ